MVDKNGHEIKAGELYRYPPDRGKWCRHGLRVTYEDGGKLYARDTYWGEGDYSYPQPVEKIASELEFLLDLNRARRSSYEKCQRYAEKDWAYIPTGGFSECYWLSIDAKPDEQKTREWLNSQLEGAEHALRRAEDKVRQLKEEIQEFESSAKKKKEAAA